MRILLWRNWSPLFDPPAVFSSIERQAIGGTCAQLLWHARNLTQLGHRIEVLGVAARDREEESVAFVGAVDRAAQDRVIRSGRVTKPDVVFLEGAFSGARFVRHHFPNAKIIHVGQNIDRQAMRAPEHPFTFRDSIDFYAFVGPGQFAEYSVRFPSLRHKFCYLPNVMPWDWIYRTLERNAVQNRVVWLGGWTKWGLRQWAVTMERILEENPECTWTLCGPSYGASDPGLPPYIFAGLNFAKSRVTVVSLPMRDLFLMLTTARVILVSLGGEAGPISVLDAHAAARPVVSGNDIVYKWANPEGTGIRTSTSRERYEAVSLLLRDHSLGDRLGAAGMELVLREYREANQRVWLERILEFVTMVDSLGPLSRSHPRPRPGEVLEEWRERIRRRLILATRRDLNAWVD